MKCYEQGIEKHITITFTRKFTKSWFTTSKLSPHFQHFQHYSKTTSNSLTRKPRPTHYSALHHKNSTAYHNVMTSRITPTRPLPNTHSLYLMCSVIFIGHLSWTVLGTCFFINNPSTATDLRAKNSSWPSWSQYTHAVGTSHRPCQNHSGNSQPRSGHIYAGNFPANRPQISSNSDINIIAMLGKRQLVRVDNPFHPFFLPTWYLLF